MINYEVYEQEIEKGNLKNGYILCGLDEEIIKDAISIIVKKEVSEEFKELNLIKIDGMNTTFDYIMNACETMPFMSEKKVVIVYRAGFLQDKSDSIGNKIYNDINKYVENLPQYTILIMYYLLNDKREKPNKNKKLNSINKFLPIVYCDKLKRDKYLKKVSDVFKEKGKPIGRVELIYFSEKVQNNFDIIKREADKLIAYCNDSEIKKDDINLLVLNSNEDDIFDLVELIAQRKIDRSIDLMKEILYKSEQHMIIISSIQKHFLRLYEIKIKIKGGKKLEDIISEYRLPQFVCEKLITQTNRFTERNLMELIKLCVKTETKLKSTALDKTMEMEFLLINTLTVKK